MSRRALSPAARGVLLAVSAALRGRVAAIDDAGDGTTHARVVEPDGTVLLDVRVRAVGRRDARQPALPLAPGAPHETPAPVAVLADARQPTAPAQDDDAADDLYRVTIGQHVTLDDEEALWEIVLEDEPAAPGGLDMLDDETAILWTSTTEKGADHIRTVVPGRLVSEIRTRTLDAGATILREEPSDAPCHLVRVGDEIETTQGLMGLLGTCDDVVNAMNGLVLEGARTVDGGKPFVAWADEVKVVDGRLVVGISKWWTAVRGPSGTWRPERLPKERREALAPAKRPKTKPARLVAVPEADALSRHGETTIAWQMTEGGAWDCAWSELGHGGYRKADAWAEAAKGHRAREYNRGGRCTRDSADEAAS